MAIERISNTSAVGSSIVGLAILMIPSVGVSQQAQQSGRGQQEVQVAIAPPQAQAQLPALNEVRVVRVKGDRIGEFEGLLKELSTTLSESNQPGFNVWRVELGDLNTYHVVAPLQSFASFAEMQTPPMEPAAWANWISRIESTIDSHKLSVARIHADLSVLPQQGQGAQQGQARGAQSSRQTQAQQGRQAAAQQGQAAAQQMPELMVLISHTVQPGRGQEYQTWVREELMPAVRRSGIANLVTNQVAFGTDSGTWVYAAPIEGWQVLDGPTPIHEALGQQAADAMLSRGEAMLEDSETIVLRFRADLSSAEAP